MKLHDYVIQCTSCKYASPFNTFDDYVIGEYIGDIACCQCQRRHHVIIKEAKHE